MVITVWGLLNTIFIFKIDRDESALSQNMTLVISGINFNHIAPEILNDNVIYLTGKKGSSLNLLMLKTFILSDSNFFPNAEAVTLPRYFLVSKFKF